MLHPAAHPDGGGDDNVRLVSTYFRRNYDIGGPAKGVTWSSVQDAQLFAEGGAQALGGATPAEVLAAAAAVVLRNCTRINLHIPYTAALHWQLLATLDGLGSAACALIRRVKVISTRGKVSDLMQLLAQRCPNLCHLAIVSRNSYEDTPLRCYVQLPLLRTLVLDRYSEHLDLHVLGNGCPRLERVDILDIRGLTPSSCLTSLDVVSASWIDDMLFSTFVQCTQLTSLHLKHVSRLTDLSPLAACTQLKSLHIGSNSKVSNIRPLLACTRLEDLELRSIGLVAEPLRISFAPLRRLTRVHFSCLFNATDLSGLFEAESLADATLEDLHRLTSLPPLAGSPAARTLQSLLLSEARVLSDLTPLTAWLSLDYLRLDLCSRARDLRALKGCPALRKVQLYRCGPRRGVLVPRKRSVRAEVFD